MCGSSQLRAIWAFGERDAVKTRNGPLRRVHRASPRRRRAGDLMKADARRPLAQARIRQQIQESRTPTVLYSPRDSHNGGGRLPSTIYSLPHGSWPWKPEAAIGATR